METSKVYAKNLKAYDKTDIRVIVNVGGTRSGKTYSILQLFAWLAYVSKEPLLFSVVTQTFPQLRQGAMRDFAKIVKEYPYEENKSDHIFSIGNSMIEFFSAESYLKVIGGQRDFLFVNEANRLGYEVVRQLMVRTSRKVFLDYNPVAGFWVNDHILPREDTEVIHSTYKDNNFLSEAQIAEIQSHEQDKNWWRVYGLGLEGRIEGLVFPDWDLADAMPPGCKVRYGIDFGFNDPTAVVRVGINGNDLYLEELCYEQGLVSADISARLEQAGVQKRSDRIIGDSAAPVQIEELHRLGWNIHPCVKGAGSVDGGIKLMKGYKIHILKDSLNLQKEMLNYMWERDKNDKILDAPVDAFNHAIDSCRYATRDLAARTGAYAIGFSR